MSLTDPFPYQSSSWFSLIIFLSNFFSAPLVAVLRGVSVVWWVENEVLAEHAEEISTSQERWEGQEGLSTLR